MIEVCGKFGIKAKILLDSISPTGVRLTTMEIEYPRIVLSELNTHRMLSKNSASTRAIPWTKMKEQLTARPVRFGQANTGMQDRGEDYNADVLISLYGDRYEVLDAEGAWESAKTQAIHHAEAFHKAGYHKQIIGRLTEPFCMMKTVISGTEWSNFFWLRDDGPADPTIAELARCMKIAYDSSKCMSMKLNEGEWHLPFVKCVRESNGSLTYFINDDKSEHILSVDDAIIVSGARCAAISFRNTDYDLEKSKQVYARLVGDDHKHGSALEHQAKVMMRTDHGDGFFDPENVPTDMNSWEDGVSHVDRNYNLWSGNFVGWIQNRKLIPGENKNQWN